jgi:hypothetical protein
MIKKGKPITNLADCSEEVVPWKIHADDKASDTNGIYFTQFGIE